MPDSKCWTRNCKDCPKIKAFLGDPQAGKFIATKESCGFIYRYHRLEYVEVEELEEDETSLTKTVGFWENEHCEWEKNGKKALTAIKSLPQDRLKEGLANRYDSLMRLDLVRVSGDVPPPSEL